MALGNDSTATKFVLMGLTQQPELQLPLFLLFLGIYAVTVVGNLGLILLIAVSPLLHTPMYYFLSSLSFIDLCYSTVTTPKMLVNFLGKKNTIIYSECMAQLFFFVVFVVAEGYLLTAMAYDRYVAICSPLLYHVIMSSWVCSILVIIAFILGFLSALAHTSAMMQLSFCKSHIISHYFCDVLPLLNLSCSSTHLNELLLFIIAGFNTLAPTLAVFISYAFIFHSILGIQSSEGRSKTFGTCSSHLLAVGIFFGSITFMYFKPPSSNSLEQEKVSSVFYTTVIPMLNPLIYSLRNKDVKKALKKVLEKLGAAVVAAASLPHTRGACGVADGDPGPSGHPSTAPRSQRRHLEVSPWDSGVLFGPSRKHLASAMGCKTHPSGNPQVYAVARSEGVGDNGPLVILWTLLRR
ncbi:olfactory receptor 8D1 [Choloepus didactylus]|uniref:olfactory receptor 8D1 n=1 Tax=Choloepus didactylus TaxID=27675 RepID=UPI00189D5648|nr:olfactory receptor 8D1 [Choloepus didactylus]